MTTATELVSRAYRLANIVGREAQVSARESEDGIKSLNEMLDYWRGFESIDLGLFNVVGPTDIPREFVEPLRYNLALRLADEVGLDVSGLTIQQAAQKKADLRNPQVPDMEIDSALLARRRFWNFTRGY